MKTWGSGGIALPFLTSALDAGEWLALCPCHFIPLARGLGTHHIGGWASPRASLDCVEKRNVSCLCQKLSCKSFGHLASCPLLYQMNYLSSQGYVTRCFQPYKHSDILLNLRNALLKRNMFHKMWISGVGHTCLLRRNPSALIC
jgi:hypothetical protein